MMSFITEDAMLTCPHGGIVSNAPSQRWVTIAGRLILISADPEKRPIQGCPFRNEPTGIAPCSQTLRVTRGYSSFIRIDGRAVCLDTVTGKTVGTPPATHDYTVKTPGQSFVTGSA
jgi:hypothetical protein